MLQSRRSARSFAIILIVHLAVILFWQFAVDAFQVPKFILPSPSAAVSTLVYAKYAWVSNTLVTSAEILGGFALGAAVGVALALVFTWSRVVALMPLPLFRGDAPLLTHLDDQPQIFRPGVALLL